MIDKIKNDIEYELKNSYKKYNDVFKLKGTARYSNIEYNQTIGYIKALKYTLDIIEYYLKEGK